MSNDEGSATAAGKRVWAVVWSTRMGLINGILFTALGVRWGLEAWRCPTGDALAFTAVMLALGGSSLVDYFAAGRDRVALMAWFHTLAFGALALVTWKEPTPFYVAVAAGWGVLSLMGPIMALSRTAPETTDAPSGTPTELTAS